MASILIVEDEPPIRSLLSSLFADEHHCQMVETAEQAIKMLDKQTYDVALTNVSLPGISGIEFLQHVRRCCPRTPVIVMSGRNDQVDEQGLRRAGAFAFLSKPFQISEVEAMVTRAIERRFAEA